MRKSAHDCASNRFTGRFVSFILSMLILAMAAPAMAQQPPPPPHQVTPWTPRTQAGPPAAPAPAPPSIPLSTTSWTFLGPGPLNSNSTNGNVSGRIAGIAAHPTVANTIYVAPAG